MAGFLPFVTLPHMVYKLTIYLIWIFGETAMEAISPANDDQVLVTQATLAAATKLGLSVTQICQTLGISKSKLERARKASGTVLTGKDYELALLLIRIYRALYAILGGNAEQIRHWVKTPNRHLQEQAPIEHMQTVQGIGLVVRYLDAMRGRI
jgi:uncharacterized protein (DUF2384 family)